MRIKLFICIILWMHLASGFNFIAAQNANYCDPMDCLFWTPQPEAIDSALVTYAQNAWSIDEWDNAAGCVIPIINVNQCENLDMMVYFPKLQPGEKRPLVLLIHGGGFISGDYTAFQSTARMLAGLGYVAATINYRLCKRNNCLVIANTGCTNLCNANFTADFLTGAYVAALDARNAILYLQQHASDFHIDPENVIVGGHSAGAWTAMNVAFLDQAEANGINPQWQSTWGAFSPVSGIKGVLCLSGAVYDTTFIDANETYPVFVLHGTCDPVVCYDADAVYHCNNSYPDIFGGRRIAERLQHMGHSYYFVSALGMGHDIGPLQTEWRVEAIRFMRSAMLCGNFYQKHATITLSPGSTECTLLQFDTPDCMLQANHAQLAPSTLSTTPVWGDFPPPCGNGVSAVDVVQSTAQVAVYPSIVVDALTIEIQEGAEEVQVIMTNLQGCTVRQLRVQKYTPEKIDMTGYPSGVYFLQMRTNKGDIRMMRVVKI